MTGLVTVHGQSEDISTFGKQTWIKLVLTSDGQSGGLSDRVGAGTVSDNGWTWAVSCQSSNSLSDVVGAVDRNRVVGGRRNLGGGCNNRSSSAG